MTMGELASSLAHELNQPLAAIASHAAGCLNRIEQTRRSPPCNWPPAGQNCPPGAPRRRDHPRHSRLCEKREPKLARLAVSELLEHTLTLAGPMLEPASGGVSYRMR